ncbi:hypothetical protein GGE65_007716 [Skermanella aerolata]|uniref:TIGR02391 family protein n=1 Tax=Skermanella aerolata TaxID=393310 RepID=UPI003D2298E3
MYNLQRTIKTVEELLSMRKDMLAMHLLRELAKSRQGEYFNRNGLLQIANAYPVDRQAEVEDAVTEAFSILDQSNFFKWAREPRNADRGFMMLTGKGEDMLDASDEKILEWQRAAEFPISLLHPKIAEVSGVEFRSGEYGKAIMNAYKEVDIAFREGACLDPEFQQKHGDLYGRPAVRLAFHSKSGPLADKSPGTKEAEREGMSNLFDGATALFRNLSFHGKNPYTAVETREILMLASLLLRTVDKAVARLSSP